MIKRVGISSAEAFLLRLCHTSLLCSAMFRLAAYSAGLAVVFGANSSLTPCPGEGGAVQCSSENSTCAQIMAESGEPLTFGAVGSFWAVTGQRAVNITGGDSMCVSMGDVAAMVEAASCEGVHIRCNATDMALVAASAENATALASARTCLEEKCGSLAAIVMAEVASELPVLKEEAMHSPFLLVAFVVVGAYLALSLSHRANLPKPSFPMWDAYKGGSEGSFLNTNTVEFVPF